MQISGRTRICGVIGDPIEHTLSPIMQNAAFAKLHLDYVFIAMKVKAGELDSAIRGARSLGIHGLNVTMPHKTAVAKLLDRLDADAGFLGAVNTILNINGKLEGYNTDGVGAEKALKENGIKLSGKKALLLGAGGAAKAISLSLARQTRELTILSRSPEKARTLAEKLGKTFGRKIVTGSLSPNTIKKSIERTDVLINATSVGMTPHTGESLVEPHWLRSDLSVMDIVYNPLETELAKDAKNAEAKVVSGVEMLVFQGAAAFEIWTNREAPVKTMRDAILNRLSERKEA